MNALDLLILSVAILRKNVMCERDGSGGVKGVEEALPLLFSVPV